jgi:hypothetical protein
MKNLMIGSIAIGSVFGLIPHAFADAVQDAFVECMQDPAHLNAEDCQTAAEAVVAAAEADQATDSTSTIIYRGSTFSGATAIVDAAIGCMSNLKSSRLECVLTAHDFCTTGRLGTVCGFRVGIVHVFGAIADSSCATRTGQSCYPPNTQSVAYYPKCQAPKTVAMPQFMGGGYGLGCWETPPQDWYPQGCSAVIGCCQNLEGCLVSGVAGDGLY